MSVTPEPGARERAWHALSTQAVAASLDVDPARGLSAAEAERRLGERGPNRLSEVAPRPAWLRFLDQFKGVLILILAVAAVVAYFVGDLTDTIVILVVVVFNAVLGFYQEHRAEQSLGALKKMLALKARVRRDGAKQEIDAAELVPGDLVVLEAGDKTPADGRLCAVHALQIDEAALTGESEPVEKHAGQAEENAPLAERANMSFMNTVVTRGRGEMLVTATGMDTEMGRIAGMMRDAPEAMTPLQLQLDRLGKRLAIIAGVVVALIFTLTLLQGHPLAAAALTAITLAVAAIPEGLPAVVTLTLALGMRRMAAQQAIVKRLAAVETLGCTTVICSDKTGTLTLNQMTARAALGGRTEPRRLRRGLRRRRRDHRRRRGRGAGGRPVLAAGAGRRLQRQPGPRRPAHRRSHRGRAGGAWRTRAASMPTRRGRGCRGSPRSASTRPGSTWRRSTATATGCCCSSRAQARSCCRSAGRCATPTATGRSTPTPGPGWSTRSTPRRKAGSGCWRWPRGSCRRRGSIRRAISRRMSATSACRA